MRIILRTLCVILIGAAVGFTVSRSVIVPSLYWKIRNFHTADTYLDKIKGTEKEKKLISNAVSYLDMLGKRQVIKTEGTRPITITWVENIPDSMFSKESNYTLGMAYLEVKQCHIELSRKLINDDYTAFITIIHELFHCYGYSHVDNPKDIMYNNITYNFDDENIKQYVKEILENSQ